MGFRQLIRNLRIEHEFNEFCNKKGLGKHLAHNIAKGMFIDLSSVEIAQKYGVHLTTVKRYRKVLGSLEESRFMQFINNALLNFNISKEQVDDGN